MEKLAQGFNTAAQDSNPGSRSRESEVLSLSHRALRKTHDLIYRQDNYRTFKYNYVQVMSGLGRFQIVQVNNLCFSLYYPSRQTIVSP